MFRTGYIDVDLFVVQRGFLITQILLNERLLAEAFP
ncbi:peptidoglycan/LPS O-acetylase OafA/YrhL [Nitrobacteraceae bacterium AZCC 2161]